MRKGRARGCGEVEASTSRTRAARSHVRRPRSACFEVVRSRSGVALRVSRRCIPFTVPWSPTPPRVVTEHHEVRPAAAAPTRDLVEFDGEFAAASTSGWRLRGSSHDVAVQSAWSGVWVGGGGSAACGNRGKCCLDLGEIPSPRGGDMLVDGHRPVAELVQSKKRPAT
jgi:hypothetical protein